MKREHYRPFDPVAAQAGAPYGHKDTNMEIRLYEYFNNYCIGAVKALSDVEWRGMTIVYRNDCLVMLPIATCQGKPVYVGDTLYDTNGAKFEVEVGHTASMLEECSWEVVPKVATSLTHAELSHIFDDSAGFQNALDAIANAAIARAIADGDVVPMEKVKEIVEFAQGQVEGFLPGRMSTRMLWSNVSAEFFDGATLVRHKLEDK